jgi:hypothetical protein
MHLASGLQLTYCTNIHPSSNLQEVMDNLERYAVPLRARLHSGPPGTEQPFGIGLRLSSDESLELLLPGELERFKGFLDERGLYVFTINGFPYGPFHGQPVKAGVHAPDWRTPERRDYTLRLIEILSHLLPSGLEGGISTSPLSYRAWVDGHDPELWATLTRSVTDVVADLVRLRQRSGQLIHLDIEPEPDGLLDRSEHLAAFFQDHLLLAGADELAAALNLSSDEARQAMRDHVQVCFDTCHVAVAHEVPAEALACYKRAGMKIGKIQISSALRLPLSPDLHLRQTHLEHLRPFCESTYLHQVIARDSGGNLQQFPDLPDALSALMASELTEARIHFHVPVFTEEFGKKGALRSTQAEIVQTFEALKLEPFTGHLEIETYTWDVLPEGLKLPLLDMVEREYRWVHSVL